MEPRCTCGAYLPADARFCHKCGKPQYEADIARLVEQESTPAPPPPVPAQIGRGSEAQLPRVLKYRALAISLLMAGAAIVGMSIAQVTLPVLALPVLLGAGFFAAVIYSRQSRTPLSVATGAFLGGLTGCWLFLFAAFGLLYSGTAQVMKQMQSMPQLAPVIGNDPSKFLATMLFVSFFFMILIAGVGGVMGAALGARRGQPS